MSELIWGVIGLLLTIMILSYLIGDNVFFRFAAHIFIGLTAGFVAVMLINKILIPYLVTPIVTGSWQQWLWMLIPLGLITLLVMGQWSKFASAGSIPLAYLAGLTAAVAVGGAVFGTLIPQAKAVIDAFDPAGWYAVPDRTWLRVTDAVVMLVGVIGTLSYFYFGKRRRTEDAVESADPPQLMKTLGKVGQVFIGITLGAVFASVFSSALIALIDRVLFIGEIILKFMGGG
jgi:hypothetical protein